MKKANVFLNTALFLLILLSAAAGTLAQLQTVGLPRPQPVAQARTQNTELTLPFWDDFSFTKGNVPLDALWLNSSSVWINDGLGINPPSLRIATLDGTDASGKPYSLTDVLAKGYADNLESQIVRIDQVDPAERSSVYLSFFFQLRGRGEAPDLGDLLVLQMKTDDDRWETVWSAENTGDFAPDQFYQVLLPIEGRFFHDQFQFRFQNFARLSGPYDTWHLDYIYLNKGRSQTDLSYPDRTLASTLGSIFATYRAIPKKHFFQSDAGLVKPAFTIHNLRLDNLQPLNYFTFANVTTFTNGESNSLAATLDTDNSLGSIGGGEHRLVEAEVSGLISLLNDTADSLHIALKLGMNTKDNLLPEEDGDYDAVKFSPIDFRNNDTLQAEYWLSSYYAYDDGTAEYGAGLNQPGAQLAYEFNLVGAPFDSIGALDLYFPRFGDESSQLIELRIWRNLTDDTDDILYRETVTVERSSQNIFWRKKLTEVVRVPARFYVGWRQSTATTLAAGLDKNTDSGNKMFFNVSGTWEQNTQVSGSLMIRPVLGKGRAGVEVGVEDSNVADIFPNPSNGTFYLKGSVSHLLLFDLSGKPVPHQSVEGRDQTAFQTEAANGLYIVKALVNGQWKVGRLLIAR